MPIYCTLLLDLAEAERILSLVVKSDPSTPFAMTEQAGLRALKPER